MKNVGVDKDVKKRIDSIKEAKIESYQVGKLHSAVIIVFALVMTAGLIMQLASDGGAVKTAGIVLVIVGAAVVLVTFLLVRSKGPLSYCTYFFLDKEGKDVILQVLSSKWMIYSYGNVVVEYKNGALSRRKARYSPETDWRIIKDATFTETGTYDKKNVWYEGTRECDGKPQRVRLTFKNGALDFIECGKMRMRFYSAFDTRYTIMVPSELYTAIELSGMRLPEHSHLIIRRINPLNK